MIFLFRCSPKNVFSFCISLSNELQYYSVSPSVHKPCFLYIFRSSKLKIFKDLQCCYLRNIVCHSIELFMNFSLGFSSSLFNINVWYNRTLSYCNCLKCSFIRTIRKWFFTCQILFLLSRILIKIQLKILGS